ncbi:MAG: hypothetical protein ACR2MX_19105, partial [Cyclobacteriaceae bacterium]
NDERFLQSFNENERTELAVLNKEFENIEIEIKDKHWQDLQENAAWINFTIHCKKIRRIFT